MIIERQRFGRGLIGEISKYVYKNPIVVYREGPSNGLDACDPYREKEVARIEICTDYEGDIVIEDWGTGIENLQEFLTIAEGQKRVREEISSYEKVSDRIIGQKGMGKMSFLSMSSINRVEFFSNNEKVGLHIILTDDPNDVKIDHMNSQVALPHRGLKVVIKRAKKIVPENRVKEYLSKTFALRIAGGAKIFVNGTRVMEPEGFDPEGSPLFQLRDNTWIYGKLKKVEKPKTDNIDIFVKKIHVCYKGFDYKVEGWINCDKLELTTSRDEIYEGNEVYVDFMTRLMGYLEGYFDKKADNIEKDVKSEKKISESFVNVIKEISDLFPELTKPFLSGSISHQAGMGTLSNLSGEPQDQCIEQRGVLDKDANMIIAKPLGDGKGHKLGNEESHCRVTKGTNGNKILAPPNLLSHGKGVIPEPTVIPLKAGDKPVVYLSAPNRLVINLDRPASNILLRASPRDPNIKHRVMPLLVRAGLDAFPGASEMSTDEYFRHYDRVLDNVC
ncbi:ATP-binding protein [Nitrososphaera sp. AFS]|uniref:ATP-binding protein n=1 Tax=Nitrososphaera sp. AFS TaxID=2301191 RepID=UPI00139237A0|nr:ATP-binding protein [Nitrososphaera sp. AFS]NAL77292.1 hypothetical protein [Nitrososphaera sp. AFS]